MLLYAGSQKGTLLLISRGTLLLIDDEVKRGTLLLIIRGTLLLIDDELLVRYIAAMARQARRAVDDGIYHVLNRGNCRMDIFQKPGDFQSFIKTLEQERQRHAMRILGYCLMNNHWHLVLWPRRGEDLSRFMGWVCTTHVRRWREHRDSVGEGHLYQGRFKSFLVQDDEHFLTVMRYMEANPLRAKMVQRAQDWPWSSLGGAAGSGGTRLILSEWPVDRPARWAERINRIMPEETLDRLHVSLARGRPFGNGQWTLRMVKRHGLENTMRDAWRPTKNSNEMMEK